MKRKVLAALAVSVIFALPVHASARKGQDLLLDAPLRASLPQQAEWALVATDLATGREMIRAGNATGKKLVPASLVKMFVTGAVLDRSTRHGSMNMTTYIGYTGRVRQGTLEGNLYLIGRGNAALSADGLDTVARTAAEKGIRRVTGNIVADESYLDQSGLERSRRGAGYAAAGALGVDLHTAALTVSAAEPGKPVAVAVAPANEDVRIAVTARASAAELRSIKITRLDDLAYRVDGSIWAGSDPVRQRFGLQHPALYAAGSLRTALKLAKVEVQGEAMVGKAPDGLVPLAEIPAAPVEKLLQEMNTNSLNVVADNLLLLLGAERYGPPGTVAKGLKEVNEFFTALGLPAGEAALVDGSGLRHGNLVTAGFVTGYLAKAYRKEWFAQFYQTLPRAGIDGTLRSSSYRNERFRVKSGRLENVFSLAGYGVDAGGRGIAFAFIVNVPGAVVMNTEEVGATVMRYLGTEVLQ